MDPRSLSVPRAGEAAGGPPLAPSAEVYRASLWPPLPDRPTGLAVYPRGKGSEGVLRSPPAGPHAAPPDRRDRGSTGLRMRPRWIPRVMAATGLAWCVFAVGCADGPSVADLSRFEPRLSLRLAASPGVPGVGGELPPIHRIRLTARIAGTSVPAGSTTVEVDPLASSWTVALDLNLPVGLPSVVEVWVELIRVVEGVERVEWSGKTEPIRIPPSGRAEVLEVQLVRGPPGNLGVTGIKIQGVPEALRRGKSVQLSASVTSQGSEGQPKVFWESLVPTVGSVSEDGRFQALGKGTARVVATAGRASDTVSFPVLPALAAVVVTPDSVVVESLGATATFAARVVDEEGGAVGGEAVNWSASPAGVVESVGPGAFRALRVGVVTVRAQSVSEPQLAGMARLVVSQVPRRVAVTPETAVVAGVGGKVQFSAVALDGNGNPVPEARFRWTTSDGGVAVVDSAGLATAVGVGEARIRAETLPPGASGGSGVVGEGRLSVPNLVGRVVDAETGAPLAGAKVEVRSSSGAAGASATSVRSGGGWGGVGSPAGGLAFPSGLSSTPTPGVSDAEGRFFLPYLAPGPYDLEVSAAGYQTVVYWGAQAASGTLTTLETIPLVKGGTGSGAIEGAVINAVTGARVGGVSVALRSGMNRRAGETVAVRTTGSDGRFSFSGIPSGTYTLTASGAGFAEGSRTTVSLPGKTSVGQDVVVNPTGGAAPSQLRIVLTWGSDPPDLDAHLFGPLAGGGRFHVYWAELGSLETPPFAVLDLDDQDGQGPETITALIQTSGPYRFFVHNYTHHQWFPPLHPSQHLANSGARVDVYLGSSLLRTFHVPSGGGTLWEVFTFENGVLTPVNTLTYCLPGNWDAGECRVPTPSPAPVAVPHPPARKGGGR